MISNSDTVILRAIERKDLPLIQKWRNMSSIQPFVREYRELSLGHIENWYESTLTDNRFEFFMILDKKTGMQIGIAGLTYIDWKNKHADLHLGLYEVPWADEHFGEDVMNTMLDLGYNHFNLNKIYAEVYEIDKEKVKLFINHNFNIDAELREHYFYKGKYVNSLILSLLKSEYEKY